MCTHYTLRVVLVVTKDFPLCRIIDSESEVSTDEEDDEENAEKLRKVQEHELNSDLPVENFNSLGECKDEG